jgi:hypothetical protein
VWRKNKNKPGYLTPMPKKIGFDFVSLGWKTKWEDSDYRFEYSPRWSFVFFKWQIALIFVAPYESNYWESWLYYEYNTNKKLSKKERITQCIKEFPQAYTQYSNNITKIIDYYPLIIQNKYINI